METVLYTVIGLGVLSLLFAWYRSTWILKQDPGTERMIEIGRAIREGAMAFLSREYRVLAIFVIIVAALLAIFYPGANRVVAVSFVFGAVSSALAGFFGMRVATNANTRTTNAARKSLNAALQVAFNGGSVMGLSVVGLGVFGLALLFLIYTRIWGVDGNSIGSIVLPVLSGFSMGASSIALFARVGGGIYTKAADVGADLVGKIEAGIPEDDPRNPATIADNVGDNVGDVAGMGADLFESFVGAIVSAMILGAAATIGGKFNMNLVILPLVLAGVGIIASV
ncbi:MAG: sodium/proton-translocating pyrophosphatase, partial [Candidatus Delongbacteria bacterium]|nr:sodium/proton-translocating pyrophosphatase [Candidatus Delongbacteria bacterium]